MSLLRFFRRGKWDRERFAELECHLQIETDESVARGMPYEEARAAAHRKLGNSTLFREDIYHMNTIAWFDAIIRDVRYGLRLLRLNPMFTAVTLLTLAIGIGANTAVFSVVNSVLLKPLPYPNPEELIAVWQNAPGAAGLTSFVNGLRLSPSMYFTYAEDNRTFQSLGVWSPSEASVTEIGKPEQVHAINLSDGLLQALGVQPAVGRWLGAGDQDTAGPQAVMLGYGFWQRRFGGERSVVGRTLRVGSIPRQIVGVMPRGFRVVDTDADLFLPLRFDRPKVILAGFGYQGIARMKPGVTIEQANADLSRMLPIWMNSWNNGPGQDPRFYENWRITPAIHPLKQEAVGNIGGVLWVVMGTVGIVMLIACANVANLLMVRTEARQQELAIRFALGAGWQRIVRELLVQSMLLGLLGGVLGIGLAYEGLRLLVAIGPANLPRLDEISLDGRALVCALVLSQLSGVLFGLIPALKYAGPHISTALRSAGRTASMSRDRHHARAVLVVAQVAMALVLLVSAGLMIRTFQALRSVEPGFARPESLETLRIIVPAALVPEPLGVLQTQNNIANKLAAIPGVTSVGFASAAPMEGNEPNWDGIAPEGKDYPANNPPMRVFKFVSPGYFQTMGTRIVAGRELTWEDVYGLHLKAMVSENLARELWGTPSAAIGKRFRYISGLWEVAGVVEDVRENGVHEKAPPIVYWPSMKRDLFGPNPLGTVRAVTFVVRSNRTATAGFLNEIRQAVWAVNGNLPVASVRTMREIFGQSMARTSFTLVMLAIAGVVALVLGLIGIYGVISYAVSQRRREIGIRLALGAQPRELGRMFVLSGLKMALAGVAIGWVAAIGLVRLMTSLLFGVRPMDPVTFVAVPVVLAAAAMLASYLPARRAAGIDPAETLRSE